MSVKVLWNDVVYGKPSAVIKLLLIFHSSCKAHPIKCIYVYHYCPRQNCSPQQTQNYSITAKMDDFSKDGFVKYRLLRAVNLVNKHFSADLFIYD